MPQIGSVTVDRWFDFWLSRMISTGCVNPLIVIDSGSLASAHGGIDGSNSMPASTSQLRATSHDRDARLTG